MSIVKEDSRNRRARAGKLCDQIAKALDLLEKWGTDDVHPVVLGSLFKLCGNARALAEGQRVHRYVRLHYPRHRVLENQAMQMYARCGRLEDAKRTFNAIAEPNVHSSNILLAAYTQNGHLEEAAEFFEWMPVKDNVAWNTMLTAYVKRGYLDDARELFRQIPDRNEVTWSTMVSAYTRSGHLDRAWFLFLEMPCKQQPAAWNAMIAGYGWYSNFDKAVQLFRIMLKEGVRPDQVTFVELLQICQAACWVPLGRHIHGMLVEMGLGSDLRVMNSLLCMYAEVGTLRETVSTFNSMRAKDESSWTAMIRAYSRHEQLDNARKVFLSMGFKTEKTWTTIVGAYAEAGLLEETRILFEEMPAKSLEASRAMIGLYARNGDMESASKVFGSLKKKDAACWSTLIAGYARNGYIGNALDAFATMDIEGQMPDREAIVAVLSACAASGNVARGRAIHVAAFEASMGTDPAVQAGVVDMYARCKSLAEARRTLMAMAARDLGSYKIVLAALSIDDVVGGKHGDRSLEMLSSLALDGIRPDAETLLALMQCCYLADEAAKVFRQIVDWYGIEPGVEHFAFLAEALARQGRAAEARELSGKATLLEADERAWIRGATRFASQQAAAALCELEKSFK